MTPLEKAEHYVEQLGPEGAWRQAADEWHNSDTQEELDYWSEVMSIIKPNDSELSKLFDEFLTAKPVKVVDSPLFMGPYIEEWRDIEDFEGLYQVSNYNRIKSLERTSIRSSNTYKVKECIRKLYVGKRGYYVVSLLKDGKTHLKTTHRLIAKAFIPNPDNKPHINHIDGNKLNNYINNLEWCTHAENLQHALDTGLRKPSRKFGSDNHYSKSVHQIDKFNGDIINTFGSAREATRYTGVSFSKIGQVCLGKRKTSGGFKWRFANE